jgi:ribosomal protein S18 acetylase RimI-like enzyme
MTASIRIATAADAAALASLAERTFRDAFGAQNSAADMDLYCGQAFGAETQRREIADPRLTTLLVEEDGALVAFAVLRDGPPHPAVAGATTREVLRFYVDRAHHGSGLAQRLMGEVVERARTAGADVLWLGVFERNPRAIRFYERCGFRQVGEQTFVLGTDPQRDVVMALRLSAPAK